jgi:hypothetical protein
MILDWVSFLAYPNLFGIKVFVVVVVVFSKFSWILLALLNSNSCDYNLDHGANK